MNLLKSIELIFPLTRNLSKLLAVLRIDSSLTREEIIEYSNKREQADGTIVLLLLSEFLSAIHPSRKK